MKKLISCFLIAFSAVLTLVFISGFSIPQIKAEEDIVAISTPNITQNAQTVNIENQEEANVLLEFPLKVDFQKIKQFDVKISSFPQNARYCKVSTSVGVVSNNKLSLDAENSFEYTFSNDMNFKSDNISLDFYDENNNLIDNNKIIIFYDAEDKVCHVSSFIGQRLITISK